LIHTHISFYQNNWAKINREKERKRTFIENIMKGDKKKDKRGLDKNEYKMGGCENDLCDN
jgi:hypothetical protein